MPASCRLGCHPASMQTVTDVPEPSAAVTVPVAQRAAPVQRKWTREHRPEKRKEVIQKYMKTFRADSQRLSRLLGCQLAVVLVDQDPEIGREGVVHGTYGCATLGLR